MVQLNVATLRTVIDVAEASQLASRVAAGDPNALSVEEMQRLLGDSALVLDGRRQRPRYFDGRFLTGADLTRDQDYVRQRQAEMARASGSGVVMGLQASLQDGISGSALLIQPGHGITPSGSVVAVTAPLTVPVMDLPEIDRLDAALGLKLQPRQPIARRTGLFILALRPVEFTANPIAAYPTTVTGPRRVEDGDVIEATAVTLIPFPDPGGAASLDEARRMVARRIFVEGSADGIPQDVMPLAMLALEGGVPRWLDMAMVRRETGADTPLQVALGNRPRALAEAHLLQYEAHLADVLALRNQAGATGAFPASQYFAALPAAGRMPAEAIQLDAMGFTQAYFPPAVDIDLSFIPSDETAALVEESLVLPPVDLLADAGEIDATGIVVLAPVTRQRLQQLEVQLSNLTRPASAADPVLPRRVPIGALATLLQRRSLLAAARQPAAPAAPPADPEVAAWQAAWRQVVGANASGLLWFIRRRTVAYQSRLVGTAVPVTGDDAAFAGAVNARLDALGLRARVDAVRARATPFAEARIVALLGAARILPSDLLLSAVVRDLERFNENPPKPPEGAPPGDPIAERLTQRARAMTESGATELPPVSEGDVLAVAEAYGDPLLGEGLARLLAGWGASAMTAAETAFLGNSGHVRALDRLGRAVAEAKLPDLLTRLKTITAASDSAGLGSLVTGGT